LEVPAVRRAEMPSPVVLRDAAAICRCKGCSAPASEPIVQLCPVHLELQRRQAEEARAGAVAAAARERSLDRAARSSPLAERPDWQAKAACRGVGPGLFYPPEAGSFANRARGADPYAIARSYCAQCPVITKCAKAARTERFGMWAGVVLHKRRRPAA